MKLRKVSGLVAIAAGIMMFIAPAFATNQTLQELFRYIKDGVRRQNGNAVDNRRASFDAKEWPTDITRFVRADINDIPILTDHAFGGQLTILGFTYAGELLQYIGNIRHIELYNPMSSLPDTSGVWYNIKLLSGQTGWLLAEPNAYPGYRFATIVDIQRPPAQTAPTQSQTQRAADPFLDILKFVPYPLIVVFIGLTVVLVVALAVTALGASSVPLTTLVDQEEGGLQPSPADDTVSPAVDEEKQLTVRKKHSSALEPKSTLPPAPILPSVPTVRLDYEGYFRGVDKRRELRDVQKTSWEQTNTITAINEQYKAALELHKTGRQIQQLADRAEIEHLDLQITKGQKQSELDLQAKEQEAKRKKIDLEIAQYDAGIEKLKNPPPRPEPPAPPKPKTMEEIVKEKAERKAQTAKVQMATIEALRKEEKELIALHPDDSKAIKSYFRNAIEKIKEEDL